MTCGIDEAGRGPLAGPVTAAAVILPQNFPFEILNDSKKLSEKKRLEVEKIIKEKALGWGLGWVWEDEIDRINILQASLLAMKYAYENMLLTFENLSPPDEAIIDGIFCPDIPIHCRAVPKADSLFPDVMAASILAKNARDHMMIRIGQFLPEYQYEKHKGYPTKLHKELLKKFGISPIQRKTFKY